MHVTLPAVPASPVLIGIDAGPNGVRVAAVDPDGRVLASTSRSPAPDDPDAIWLAVVAGLDELRLGRGHEPAAVGLAADRDTVVAWDRRTGDAFHPAVPGTDRRTAARCDRLEAGGHQPQVRETTGLVLDPTFAATRMAWLLAEGGVRAGPGLALGTLDAFLLWRLTDGAAFATDHSMASRTMLYDIRYGVWSTELCDLFGVPKAALPELGPTTGRLGTTAGGVPVSALVGDEPATLFAQGCIRPGMAKTTYGRGSVVLRNAGDRCPVPADGLLTTVAWSLAGARPTFAYEGSIAATGAALDWLRDGLGVVRSAGEAAALAGSLRDAQGVAFVPAFSGLGSPWWDPRARGAIVGLTRGSGRAQLARAAVEAMAYQTRDVVDAMTAAAGPPLTELRVDGESAALDLLLQIQADQIRAAVARAAPRPTAAVGAALLAGLAEGVWSSVEEVAALWPAEATFEPRAPQSVVDDRHATWLRAVGRARRWSAS
jgi:glycerol kinase